MVVRTDHDIATAAEVTAANAARERFVTGYVRVFSRATVKGFPYPSTAGAVPLPVISKVDWTAPETACTLPPPAG